MPAFNIRNMSEEQIDGLDRLARQAGLSRQVYAATILIEHVEDHASPYDPDLLIGWFRLDRFADIDAGDKCNKCGNLFGQRGIWLAVSGDFKIHGALCEVCAMSE